ncbi:MAG: hypothetical protein A2Z21_05155 [Candidatus Fraserbacteria bacterium RBG_16_55_9]|uniref:TPM domain-containing protein n=1 Tax=Fraserbacteria sp. (strain RBG_16_55_9) TaxID=1817864 RepID=A0A1F5US58_FRAXR|nr:MAG: hypothetical protein A2Z21_05155 [Candidatus Fraserbacteria bacterium RBG_16_55_9]
MVWTILADEPAPPPLPKAIGAINDYAAALGRESRQQLQTWIDELRAKTKINVFLLITLLDPYSDPPTFTQVIWESWRLGTERTIFLLLAKETDHWVFHWKSSTDLALRLANPSEDYQRLIQGLLDQRRVGTAAVQAVDHLRGLFIEPELPKPQEEQPLPSPAKPRQSFLGSSTFWYALGGLAGVGGIAGLIVLARARRCPRCGGRMSRRSTQPFGSSYAKRARRRTPERVYYCRQCGYQRVRRRER